MVLPVPVGPVSRTSPRCDSASETDHRRQQQLLERRNLRAHPADRKSNVAALAIDVYPETTHSRQRVAEVGLVLLRELPRLVLGHERASEQLGVGAGQRWELPGRESAVHAHEGHVPGLEVEIARPHLDRVSEQLSDVHDPSPGPQSPLGSPLGFCSGSFSISWRSPFTSRRAASNFEPPIRRIRTARMASPMGVR